MFVPAAPAGAAPGRTYANPVKSVKGADPWIQSPDGAESWIVYHANDGVNEGCDNNRTARAQKFTWNSDNTPNFGTPARLGATAPGPAGETEATPTAYGMVNRNSGKCLDVADGSAADGADVRQWACNGANAQHWRIEDQGDDTNRLINVATGKVADVANCGTGDGVDVRQWSWLNNTCQQWEVVPA